MVKWRGENHERRSEVRFVGRLPGPQHQSDPKVFLDGRFRPSCHSARLLKSLSSVVRAQLKKALHLSLVLSGDSMHKVGDPCGSQVRVSP